jgi:predicted Zn-dependent peptidase
MVGDITDDVIDVARVMSALAPWGDDVTVDETAGFPVLFARRPGRMSGGLIFRVGWADERLSRAGITHLIEHLALSGLHKSHFPHGGVTRELTTLFYAQGTSEQIVTFLNGVTSALGRGLPWERIPREKNILETEELGHSWAAAARHRLERHGAQGRGLNGYGAAGLDAITKVDVREWLARYFTGGNVIGWISGEHLPEGLEAHLPTGIRRAVPPPSTILESMPAVFPGPPSLLVIDALVARSPAASVFARLVSRMLTRALRHEAALSYTASCEIEAIDADTSRLSIAADAKPENQSELVAQVFETLSRVRSGDIDMGDLHASAHTPSAEPSPLEFAESLPELATEIVMGHDIVRPDERDRRRTAVSIDDIRAVAEQFFASALAQSPTGEVPDESFRPLSPSSETAVTGRVHPLFGVKDHALYIAPDGISLREHGRVYTVAFDDCVLLERWPDGARRLTGVDGFQVVVEPTLYANISREIIRGIDASVGVDAIVDRPARAVEDIPRPPALPLRAPAVARRIPGFGIAATVILILFLVGAGLTFNDALHIDTPFSDGTVASGATVVGGMVTCAVLAVISAALFSAEYARRRRRSSQG